MGLEGKFWDVITLRVEGVESETNTQNRQANDDRKQITATIICLIQNTSLINTRDINGKQLLKYAVSINHGDIRRLNLRPGRFMSIKEIMFGEY